MTLSVDAASAARVSEPPIRRRTVLVASGAVVAITVVVAAVAAAILFAWADPLADLPQLVSALLCVHSVACLGALCVVIRRAGVTSSALGITPPGWRLLHLLWQVPVVIGLAVLTQIGVSLAFFGGGELPGGNGTSTLMGAAPWILAPAFIAITVVAPLWEELFFRGILQGGIAARWGTFTGVAAPSIVFAAVHGYLFLTPYYLVLGLALGFLRVFHRSLWGPLLLHMTINVIASSALVSAVG